MVECQADVLTPSGLSDLTYRVRDPQVDLNFGDFGVAPLCAYQYTYTVEMSKNGGVTFVELDPKIFTFDDTQNLISIYALSGFERTIQLRVTGDLSQSGGSTSFTFKVKMLEENYPPVYINAPGNYTVVQGDELSFPVWPWADPDNDLVNHLFNFGKADKFARYDPVANGVIFEPRLSQHIGLWEVFVEI